LHIVVVLSAALNPNSITSKSAAQATFIAGEFADLCSMGSALRGRRLLMSVAQQIEVIYIFIHQIIK